MIFRVFAGDKSAALQLIKLTGYLLEFIIAQLVYTTSYQRFGEQ